MSFDFSRGPKSFSLLIKVTDPGGLFITGNIKIFLINVNNKVPILTCSLFNIKDGILTPILLNSTTRTEGNITLDEETPVGKTLGSCQATDEDQMGHLTFELDPGNRYFAIDKGGSGIGLGSWKQWGTGERIRCKGAARWGSGWSI
ncbi:cadherin-related family member 3-like [Antechinus flavipes]|uniref:cadherin-related family member 3-like n=1 Tax=Antechinus flavipes TaxID=38775 RepID=UPI0022359137|nr:cadherin-related family member 3-like [Antechinus flavipes]